MRPDRNVPKSVFEKIGKAIHVDKIKKFHGEKFLNKFPEFFSSICINGYSRFDAYISNANVVEFGYDFVELHDGYWERSI